ncbi:hypothetical protein LBMAG42_47670 [Deltaproteobacteria bacterium]|nr:hypothetical protein LBMAG42_47670 [Deltaproteobacteria bacterium]
MRTSVMIFGGIVLFLSGCTVTVAEEKEPGASDPDSGALEEIPVGDDTGQDGTGDGVISGTVAVELYTYDALGELVWSDWEEAYPDGDFPFGSIFVAAYALDEEALSMNYLDQYVIRSPDPEGNSYEVQVDPEIAANVRLYAVLDYWGDGILSTNEPMGIWPDTVPVVAGAEVAGVDIDIPAPYYDFGTGSGGGGGGNGVGGGGGGGTWNVDDYVLISGQGLITESYAGGSCISLLYLTDGTGPYYADAFTPVKTDSGAEGDYAMYVPKNWGAGTMLGAWDSNFNGLIDPADKWGEYVDSTGVSANPIMVEEDPLADHTIMIPSGSGSNPSVVPFVVLSGAVTVAGGFDALGAGAKVHVAAMKYKPEADVSAADIPGISYDYASYSGADLTGDGLAFTLVAPANTIVYLWAYLDADGDGNVNEPGEAVASYGNDPSGHLPTGTSSHPDIELPLVTVTE